MRWLVSFVAAVFLVILPVSGASGHAGLVSSSPQDGARLDVAPEEVVLTFDEELLSELVDISILDAADEPVVVTEVPQTPPPGTDVKVPWPADLPPGEYSVAFRVVSADGHPVTGRVSFSYANVESPEPAPMQSPAPVESPPQSPVAVQPVQEEPVQEVLESPTPQAIAAADEPGSSLIGPLLIAAAVIVGAGVIFCLVMLARSRQ